MCVDFTNLNKACPKDSFPLAKNRLTYGFHSRTQAPHIHGHILGIQPDKDVRRRLGEDYLHHQPGALLLQGNSLQTEKCRSDLLEVSQQNVQ